MQFCWLDIVQTHTMTSPYTIIAGVFNALTFGLFKKQKVA